VAGWTPNDYRPSVPEESDAVREARLATEFFDALVASGKPERICVELTVAFILGRQRREREDTPEWER
jgi:hypothetical protein